MALSEALFSLFPYLPHQCEASGRVLGAPQEGHWVLGVLAQHSRLHTKILHKGLGPF